MLLCIRDDASFIVCVCCLPITMCRDVLAASHASQIAAGIPSSQPPLSMSSVDGLFMFNARVVAIPSTTPLHQFGR